MFVPHSWAYSLCVCVCVHVCVCVCVCVNCECACVRDNNLSLFDHSLCLSVWSVSKREVYISLFDLLVTLVLREEHSTLTALYQRLMICAI